MIKYIQRKRIKGWSLEQECEKLGIKRENVVNCTRGSKWGNPHRICIMFPTKKDLVDKFEEDIIYWGTTQEIKKELKGKVLMCWCSQEDFDNGLCHCSMLWKIANN